MPLVCDPWVLPALMGGFTAWGLALVVLRRTPDRALGARMAGVLFPELAAIPSSGGGLLLLAGSAASAALGS